MYKIAPRTCLLHPLLNTIKMEEDPTEDVRDDDSEVIDLLDAFLMTSVMMP